MTQQPGPEAALDEGAQKQIALDLILQAWEDATGRGVAPELVATVAMTAAITDMVDRHGEEAMARVLDTLPARVRAGEYTLSGSDG